MSANKSWFRITSIIATLVALITIFPSCKKAPTEEPMVMKISDDTLKLSDEAIKNLKLAKAVKTEFPEKLAIMGRIAVTEDKTVMVPARVSGRMSAVYVASGEIVSAGQPLASVYSADYAIAREEYLQAVRDAKTNPTKEAKHFLELAQKKLNAIGVSASDIASWGSGENSEKKAENITIRAPIGGALLGKNAVLGNLVNVGDPLFTIGDLHKVWFAGDLYPEDLPKVHLNQTVIIDPETGGPMLRGTVSFISPVIDPTSRTIKIRALMDNPNSELRADMYVQGNLIIRTREAITAPKAMLVHLADTLFVFKRLPGGNLFQKVSVQVDGDSSDKVSVSKGLNDGDEVVSEGGLFLDAALKGAGT